jgi:hypothetical protein
MGQPGGTAATQHQHQAGNLGLPHVPLT